MVYVKIDDVNDHAPQFNSTSYVIPTSISSESGTLLHTFSVRDNFDILENSAVYVRIPSYYDDANDMFDVSSVEDSDDFILTLGERPRSQGLQVRNYTFRLEAVTPAPCPDCPQFQQVSYADVTVVVHPANDHCPEFNQSVYSESIVEEATLSQPIMRVSASDPEQNNIRYTIDYNSTNLSDRFSIDAETGDIMLLTTLDREAMPVHEFTVLSSDDGFPSLTCTSTVRITVTDINDNVPTFVLEWYPGYIKENADPAVASVTRVRAVDPDLGQAGVVEYRLTLSGELPFRIDSSTGEIFTTEELDFETKHQYSFPVYASNPDSNMQASATVEVNVIDVNEFQPVFETKPAGPVFIEQGLSRGAIVAVVSATDRDGGHEGVVTYSFGNNAPKDYFAINSTTGVITFKGVFEETSGNGNIVKRQAESIDDYFRVQAVIVATDGSYVETTDIEFHVRNSYDPNLRPNPTSAAPRGLLIGVVAGVVAAVVVIFIVLCICAMFCRRRRHSKTGQIKDVNGPMNNGMEMGRFSSQHSSQRSGSSTRSSRYQTGIRPEHSRIHHSSGSLGSNSNRESYIAYADDEMESVAGEKGVYAQSLPRKSSSPTSDLASTVGTEMLTSHSQEHPPYTKAQIAAIYAANTELLDNSGSQNSILFGSEGSDGDMDIDTMLFKKLNDFDDDDDDDDDTTLPDDNSYHEHQSMSGSRGNLTIPRPIKTQQDSVLDCIIL